MWIWSLMAFVSLAMIAYVLFKAAMGYPLTPEELMLFNAIR